MCEWYTNHKKTTLGKERKGMRREWLPGKSGFPVPCVHTLTGEEQTVCVLTHGFGSGKDGETVRRALAELPRRGIGAVSYTHLCR